MQQTFSKYLCSRKLSRYKYSSQALTTLTTAIPLRQIHPSLESARDSTLGRSYLLQKKRFPKKIATQIRWRKCATTWLALTKLSKSLRLLLLNQERSDGTTMSIKIMPITSSMFQGKTDVIRDSVQPMQQL